MGEEYYPKSREEVIEKIKEFKKKVNVEKIIIFGSFARGEFEEDSDLDLILVGKVFEGKPFYERLKGLWLKWDLRIPVDFLCYTPEEFENLKKGVNIVSEAVKEGIEV